MGLMTAVFAGIVGLQGGQLALPEAQRDVVPSVTLSDAKTGSDAPGQVLRFERQKLMLRLPLGWQRLPGVGVSNGLVASFAPLGASGATLALSYSEDPGRTRLPDNLPTTIAAALGKRYAGFQQTGRQRLILAGADSWQLDGQLRPPGQDMIVRSRQVYICHQGRIYILTLSSKKEDFERLAPSVDRLLRSIVWL